MHTGNDLYANVCELFYNNSNTRMIVRYVLVLLRARTRGGRGSRRGGGALPPSLTILGLDKRTSKHYPDSKEVL